MLYRIKSSITAFTAALLLVGCGEELGAPNYPDFTDALAAQEDQNTFVESPSPLSQAQNVYRLASFTMEHTAISFCSMTPPPTFTSIRRPSVFKTNINWCERAYGPTLSWVKVVLGWEAESPGIHLRT